MKINYFQQGGQYRMTPEEIQKQASINMMGEAGFNRMNLLADEVYANFIKNNPIDTSFLKPINRELLINPVNDDIVNQVIKGKFGNGQARIDALTVAGYNPKEVLAAVNARLRSAVVAPKQETTPALPTVETPAAVNPAPVLKSATLTLASPVIAPAPIRNQASTNPTNVNRQMKVGSDYRQYRREFARKNNLNFAPNLFGELGNKREQFVSRKTGRVVPEEDLLKLGWNPYYKKGGQINYFQQGGQMQQDPVEQVIQRLLQDPQGTMQLLSQMQGQQGGKEQVNAILQEIVKRAKSGDQQAVQAVQVLQQAMQGGQQTAPQQQTPAAKNGAKLNYLKQLKGKCPEGEELVYMKKGGVVCPVCQKKKDGGEAKAPKKQYFGKDKKVAKAQEGGDTAKISKKVTAKGDTITTEKYPNRLIQTFSPSGIVRDSTASGISIYNPNLMPVGGMLVSPLDSIKYENILKQPAKPIYKQGGKTQFFKKLQKAPIAKCGSKMKADKCGGKMKAKKK